MDDLVKAAVSQENLNFIANLANEEKSQEIKFQKFKNAGNIKFTLDQRYLKKETESPTDTNPKKIEDTKFIPLIVPMHNFVALPNFFFQKGMVILGASKSPGRKQMRVWINDLILIERENFILKYEGERPYVQNLPYIGAIIKEYAKKNCGEFGPKEIEIKEILKSAMKWNKNLQLKSLMETFDLMAIGRFISHVKNKNGNFYPQGNYSFINSYEIKDGNVTLDINPEVGKILENQFTQIDLRLFNNFKGGLTKFLYCYLTSNLKYTSFNKDRIFNLVTDFTKGDFKKYELNKKLKDSLNQLYKAKVIPKYISEERNPVIKIGNRLLE